MNEWHLLFMGAIKWGWDVYMHLPYYNQWVIHEPPQPTCFELSPSIVSHTSCIRTQWRIYDAWMVVYHLIPNMHFALEKKSHNSNSNINMSRKTTKLFENINSKSNLNSQLKV